MAGAVGAAITALAHLAALVPALDGESVDSGNTALGVVSVVSIVFGWLLIGALWWFVFRDKARAGRRKRGGGK